MDLLLGVVLAASTFARVSEVAALVSAQVELSALAERRSASRRPRRSPRTRPTLSVRYRAEASASSSGQVPPGSITRSKCQISFA